jgi:hypothetical protein
MISRERRGMRVRLTRRLAECIDGVDLSRNAVGDVMDLSARDAKMLVAEGWANPADGVAEGCKRNQTRSDSADRPARRRTKRPTGTDKR